MTTTLDPSTDVAPSEQLEARRPGIVWLGNDRAAPWPTLAPAGAEFEQREDGAWALAKPIDFEPLRDDPGVFSEAIVGFVGDTTLYRCQLVPPLEGLAKGDIVGFNAGDLEVFP